MTNRRSSGVIVLFLVAMSAVTATAGAAVTVGPDPDCDFATLQAAVDAATSSALHGGSSEPNLAAQHSTPPPSSTRSTSSWSTPAAPVPRTGGTSWRCVRERCDKS